jgi:hypothetical protein
VEKAQFLPVLNFVAEDVGLSSPLAATKMQFPAEMKKDDI